jgi:hypothetical protein
MKEIDTASDATLKEVAENVINNIDTALSQHDQQLKELSSALPRLFALIYFSIVNIDVTAQRSMRVFTESVSF